MAKIDDLMAERRRIDDIVQTKPGLPSCPWIRCTGYGIEWVGSSSSYNDDIARRVRDFLCEWYGLPESSGWKPASTPPDSMRDVLVCDAHGERRIGCYGDGWRINVLGAVSDAGVFYWHELPAAPTTPTPRV